MNFELRKIIRKQYEASMPYILKNRGRVDVYRVFPWVNEFSPIEAYVWNVIRCLGIKMFPQFPVKQYFLDFGDPIHKIGIEVDGKEFHKDLEKDKRRENEIEAEGWKIIRITGSEANRACNWQKYFDQNNDIDDEESRPNIHCSCAECILRPLRDYYIYEQVEDCSSIDDL